MGLMSRERKIFGIVAGIAGLFALVAPFTAGTSPIGGMLLAYQLDYDGMFLFSISAPALLAIPIAMWQVRRIFVPEPSALEITLAYLFATSAMLPVLGASFLAGLAWRGDDYPLYRSALAVDWCAVIGNCILLIKNRRDEQAPGVSAEVFLLLGYIPNAMFILIFFSYWTFIFGPTWGWDFGAYVVLTTCVLYGAQAFLLLRRGEADVG